MFFNSFWCAAQRPKCNRIFGTFANCCEKQWGPMFHLLSKNKMQKCRSVNTLRFLKPLLLKCWLQLHSAHKPPISAIINFKKKKTKLTTKLFLRFKNWEKKWIKIILNNKFVLLFRTLCKRELLLINVTYPLTVFPIGKGPFPPSPALLNANENNFRK